MGGLDEWLPPAYLGHALVAGTETGLQTAQVSRLTTVNRHPGGQNLYSERDLFRPI
jgi:hypothetical protein